MSCALGDPLEGVARADLALFEHREVEAEPSAFEEGLDEPL
jgi:hypothetical protein